MTSTAVATLKPERDLFGEVRLVLGKQGHQGADRRHQHEGDQPVHLEPHHQHHGEEQERSRQHGHRIDREKPVCHLRSLPDTATVADPSASSVPSMLRLSNQTIARVRYHRGA